ncbi:hypothetical protein NDU88_009302 [Pleurodeles waltl]|uniref:Lipoxygenase domain-containing protein n=1 Tax=Pleurodeles waltl TaxID=8319 RepID=A0AAV7QUW9_PLEWA|nr:hypothetical protein NDU88_009302 [Pleurodeles waltl]
MVVERSPKHGCMSLAAPSRESRSSLETSGSPGRQKGGPDAEDGGGKGPGDPKHVGKASYAVLSGMYPDEHFVEKPMKVAMAKFRKNLDDISSLIHERNKNKKLPYYYFSPDRIPNSVAV